MPRHHRHHRSSPLRAEQERKRETPRTEDQSCRILREIFLAKRADQRRHGGAEKPQGALSPLSLLSRSSDMEMQEISCAHGPPFSSTSRSLRISTSLSKTNWSSKSLPATLSPATSSHTPNTTGAGKAKGSSQPSGPAHHSSIGSTWTKTPTK